MNIKELKEIIAELPDDMEVILQSDSEGNGYSPAAGADPDCVYVPENSYSGVVYSTDYISEETGFDDDEWEEVKKGPKALVLWPMN